MRILFFGLVAAAVVVGGLVSASASQLTYTPVNPNFGGNPSNGTYLLSTAQAQGVGAKSGQAAQSVDLSGLTNSLNNIGNSPGLTVANPTSSSSSTIP